jgi:hypothetical protein
MLLPFFFNIDFFSYKQHFATFCIILQGSTLTVARLPGASEMRLRASENGNELARWGK